MKNLKKILSLSFTMLISIATFAAEPPNLGLIVKQELNYVNSGEYQQNLQKQITVAEQYLLQRVQENAALAKPKKLAMVLDIDETSLSNLPFMMQNHFQYSVSAVMQHIAMGQDPAIQPTLALYNLAKMNGVAVFFVTGRSQNLMAATRENLNAVGYKNWNGLFLEPLGTKYASAANYKAPIRQRIEQQGYDIILNIGDQNSDLAGGFADNAVKLSDPFYYLP